MTTGKGIGPETIYTRGKASDHMAQKVTIFLDIVEKGKAGNRAIINYNNRKGWLLYTVLQGQVNELSVSDRETCPRVCARDSSVCDMISDHPP